MEREDSPRDSPARLVKLEDRCALDFLAASLDDPGIVMGDVERPEVDPASSLSVAEPSSASVVLASRFEDDGVDPPEDWLRSRLPNSVLYMLGHSLERRKPTPARYGSLRMSKAERRDLFKQKDMLVGGKNLGVNEGLQARCMQGGSDCVVALLMLG